jgi:chromosome segregation ATPase
MEQMWLIAQEVAEKIFDHFQQLQPQIVGALQSGIDQLTRPPDSPTGLELRLADLQETLLARDNELAISRKQIQDLQMKLARKENEKAALMPLRSRVSSLEFKLLEKDAEGISQIQDLQMKLVREENARAALVPLQSRVDFLEFKLLQKEGEFFAAQQGLHGKLEKMETEKLQSCMAQINHLEKQLAQKESERVLMAQRFATQPQVDGETWQYQTSRGKWISFPDPLKTFAAFFLEGIQGYNIHRGADHDLSVYLFVPSNL